MTFYEAPAQSGADDPAQPLIDWINNAPLPDLAAEVMAVFGPGGASGFPSEGAIVAWMLRSFPKRSGLSSMFTTRPVHQAVGEALQLLEHAELIMAVAGDSGSYWRATRLGLATLADGKPAVRQRVCDRTGF